MDFWFYFDCKVILFFSNKEIYYVYFVNYQEILQVLIKNIQNYFGSSEKSRTFASAFALKNGAQRF